MKLLVSSGAKIQTFDNKLNTPLSIAAQKGNIRLVEYFLSKGGSLKIKDEANKTPTMRANRVKIYETTAEQKSLGKLLIPLALEYNLPDFKLCLRHGADIDARILEAALAGCKLDMTLESFTNIQYNDDDLKKIRISIEMVQELVRHGVDMYAMQDSHETVLIALLIAAVDCEGLLELLPKLRRIIGIALQRNDNSASWTAEKIEIIEGSRPLRDRIYLDRQGIANLLDRHQGTLSTNKDRNTARTAATVLLGIIHLTSTNHPPDWADQVVCRAQEIENFRSMGNKFFRSGDFDSALESYDTGLQVIHDHGVPEHDWTRLYFTLHCNRLICLIALNKYEIGKHERLLEMCGRRDMAEIAGKQLMEKAWLRCAKYCKALDDPTRASLCLERGFNPKNEEMRKLVKEVSGNAAAQAYNLIFPTFIRSSYESHIWWNSIGFDIARIQIDFQFKIREAYERLEVVALRIGELLARFQPLLEMHGRLQGKVLHTISEEVYNAKVALEHVIQNHRSKDGGLRDELNKPIMSLANASAQLMLQFPIPGAFSVPKS